jgi:hypothetical protein
MLKAIDSQPEKQKMLQETVSGPAITLGHHRRRGVQYT